MTQMNVQMSLTLADAASGPLKAFADILGQLKTSTNNVAPKLDAIAAGMKSITTSASGSAMVGMFATELGRLATTLGTVKASATGVGAELSSIGNRAGGASLGTLKLQESLTALGTTLEAAVVKMTAAAGSMAMIGTAAREAGAGVKSGVGQIEGSLISSVKPAETLTNTLKGLAAIWGAIKIEKGLAASISEAGKYEQSTKGVEALGLGKGATAEIISKAWDDSKALKFVSVLDAIAARMNAIGGLAEPMNQHILDSVIQPSLKLANNLKFLGDKTAAGDLVQNIFGLFEARGQTENPEAMKRTMDLVQKAAEVTHGKIGVRDFEILLRGIGAGAQNISDDGLMRLVELMNQEKIAGGAGIGGGASRLSTQVKLLQAYATGKAMNKQGAEMLIEADILNPGAINEDGSAVLSRNIKPSGVKNAQLAVADPIKWIEQNAGKIIAYTQRHKDEFYAQGADLTNPENIDAAVQKFLTALGFTVTATKLLASATNPRTQSRIEKGVGMQQQAMGVDQFDDKIKDTYQQNLTKFNAALENLKINIGVSVLPAITSLIEKFGQFFGVLAGFAQNHPVLTHLAVLATTVIGVTLAINGMKNVFGIVGSLSTALLGLGRAGTVGAAEAAAAATTGTVTMASRFTGLLGTISAVATGIGRAFLRMIPWVGAVLIAWDLGQLIWNLEIGGKKIGEWAVTLSKNVGDSFEKMWLRTKQFFGFMTKDAADAIIAANRAASEQRNGSFAGGGGKMGGKGASGSWGDPALSADEIRAQQLREAASARSGPKVNHDGKDGAGRFANFDAELDAAKNANRLLEDEQKRQQQVEDELYKAGRISINAYYDDKIKTLTASILKEIEQLEKEKAAYAKQGDKAGVNKATTDITLKTRDLIGAPELVEIERQQALNKLDKDAIDIKRELMKTSGEKHAAEMQKAQQELEAKLKIAVLNKDRTGITQEMADERMAMAKAAIDYQTHYVQIAQIQEAYADRIAQINDAERNGLLSSTSAESQKLTLMKQESAELDELIAKLRVYAVASGNDKAVVDLDKMSVKNRSTQGILPAEDIQMLKAVQSGFTDIFKGIMTHSMSAGKAIEKFAQNLKQTFLDIISKRLGDALFDSLFGSLMGGGRGGGGGGGFLGLFSGLFGGMFGGGSVGGGESTTPGFSGGDLGGGIKFGGTYATGIDTVPHDMLALIHKDERVMTASDNKQYTNFAQMMGRNNQPAGPTTVMLQAHPDIMNMRFQDVLDAHMSHALATRS